VDFRFAVHSEACDAVLARGGLCPRSPWSRVLVLGFLVSVVVMRGSGQKRGFPLVARVMGFTCEVDFREPEMAPLHVIGYFHPNLQPR
jgi:hypothetical protein